jgi:septal ring factor EnvC (AmiA/AmiB activator)
MPKAIMTQICNEADDSLNKICAEKKKSKYKVTREILESKLLEEKIASSSNQDELTKNVLNHADHTLKQTINEKTKEAADFSEGQERSAGTVADSEKPEGEKSDTTPRAPLKRSMQKTDSERNFMIVDRDSTRKLQLTN